MLSVGYHSRGLQKQAAIWILTHYEALVGPAGEDCAAPAIGFDKCKLSHHTKLTHFPTMGNCDLGCFSAQIRTINPGMTPRAPSDPRSRHRLTMGPGDR